MTRAQVTNTGLVVNHGIARFTKSGCITLPPFLPFESFTALVILVSWVIFRVEMIFPDCTDRSLIIVFYLLGYHRND